jgi:hypothetical protein
MERYKILLYENETFKFNSMKTLVRESIQDLSESNNNFSTIPFYELLNNQDESFYKSYPASSLLPGKERIRKSSFIKRITPFLILEIFLMALFPYMFLTGKVIMQSVLVTTFLFPFIIINVLFLDFTLCNYFGNKKIFRIWFIESVLSFVLIYLLI